MRSFRDFRQNDDENMASVQSPTSTSSQNGNDDEEIVEIVPIDNYNAEEVSFLCEILRLVKRKKIRF